MHKLKSLIIAVLLLAPLSVLNAAELKLASVFTDNAILQRDIPVPVWGTADPGEEITVEFAGQKKSTKADSSGKWQVKLDPIPASATPQDLLVSSSHGSRVTFHNILLGDVWLCSGQSNMGFNVHGADNAEQEIANANYPLIRLFAVAQNPALTPTNAIKGEWVQCSTQTVGNFSAAAYFFGRELHKELKIPIGLLHSSVGGTPAEAWTRLEALKTIPALAERAEKEIAQIKSQEDDNKRFVTDRAAWEKKYGVEPPPIAETACNWADPELKTDDWSLITLPNQWAQLGAKSGGVFWVRRDVTLPESAAGKQFGLGLNWVSEQYDTAFFNGVEVGHASDKAPDFYNQQRRYNVPGKLVKTGRNVIAVRIVSATERAGMWQWGHMLGLPVADQTAVDNKWLMKTESAFPALPPEALKSRPKPNNIPFRSVSAALYNGMIAPLIPFAIKGAIWYQGESNAGRSGEYRELLSTMIRDWRAQWAQPNGDFPFIIQQLVNNGQPAKDPNQTGGWPALRETQMLVAETVPNCGIAVGMELGSAFTIHPKNKQDVGKRLALVALEKTYGQKIESSGPRYESMKIEGNSIRVKFTHANGLQTKGGPLKAFAIAAADGKFTWADAKIEGETVIVSSPQVPQPVSVRYAWAENPEGCTLYNAAGLPAAPFSAGSSQPESHVKHRFFKCGWASGGPAIYGADFKPEWSLDNGAELTDGWVLPDNGIVFSYSIRGKEAGIIRLDPEKKQLWKYIAPDNHDNHSCQPLPGGGFLAAETAANGMWMVEIDKDGKEQKRIKVGDSTRDMHHTFRQVRKTALGTYLAAIMNENKTYEWDAGGKLLRTFPKGAFVAIRLPNGNTLVTAAHPAADHGVVIEYDREAKVVWEVTQADIESLGIQVSMVCGAQRLPNGNTVITSASHGKPVGAGDMVKAFEITPAKKLAWSIPGNTAKGNMGNIQILDIPGDVYNFEVLK